MTPLDELYDLALSAAQARISDLNDQIDELVALRSDVEDLLTALESSYELINSALAEGWWERSGDELEGH